MEENNESKDKEIISIKPIQEDKLLNQATLKDLMLFKDDILKELKQYVVKIKSSLSDRFDKFVEEANHRLPPAMIEGGELYMKNIKFLEEKNDILATVTEKEAGLNEKIMVCDLHINNCQKELNDVVFKLDRTILDNLLIPGVVGKGCKFGNFREYIVDMQGQINKAFSRLDYDGLSINKNRKNIEDKIDEINTKIKNLETDLKQFTTEKTLLLENKNKDDMETMNKGIIELTGEFYKNNAEMKNQIDNLKNLEKLITEENRKINFHTMNEFAKIKKGYTYMKKTIVDLGKLLMLSDKRTNRNKNFAANKQLIIEQFNNMMMNLVKDDKNDNSPQLQKEQSGPKKEKPKKPVSVIKKYIEGKIHVDDSNYFDIERKEKKSNNSKDKENEELIKRNSLKKAALYLNKLKTEDDISLKQNNNNNKGAILEKYKSFNRHSSVEYNEILKKSSGGMNFNNNSILNNQNDLNKYKSNNINSNFLSDLNNKSHHFGIIKEENNNMSKSGEGSIFSDLEEDFKNLQINEQTNNFYNYKGNETKKYDDENSLFNNDSVLNKPKKINKNKLFFRAATQNFDIRFRKGDNNANNVNNETPEKFKLLLKAQENLNKKNFEKMKSFKKENGSTQDKNFEKKASSRKINFNIQEKTPEKKSTINQENFSQNNNNQESSRFENKSNINNTKVEEAINKTNNNNTKSIENKTYSKNANDKIKEINNEENNKLNNEDKNNSKKNKNADINNIKQKIEIKNEDIKKITDIQKEKNLFNYKLKDNVENETLSPKNNKPKTKIIIDNNNFTKTQYLPKNLSPIDKRKKLSPKNNKLELAKIENNKENVKREINLSANFKKTNNNINNIYPKFPTQNNLTKSSIQNLKTNKAFNIANTTNLTKSNINFRVKRNHNLFNEDIFVDKDEFKKLNYYHDKDIIDKPLLVNQYNFKLENSKGTIENKLIELEYFTKKKFDELVREIKNFIPIHFNAYVKE